MEDENTKQEATEEQTSGQEATEPGQADSSAESAQVDGQAETTGQAEDEQLMFLPAEDRHKYLEEMQKHPEQKPLFDYFDGMHKKITADYTRKMQAVPKEYRDKEAFGKVLRDANAYRQMQTDPNKADFAKQATAAAITDATEQAKGKESNEIENLLKDASPDMKLFFQQFQPLLKAAINAETKPLVESSRQREEREAKTDLANKYGSDIEFDGPNGFWADAVKLKREHPEIFKTYADALQYAVKDLAPEFYLKKGQEMAKADANKEIGDAKSKLNNKVKSSAVIGGGSRGQKTLSREDEAKMTPEEFADFHGLQRASQ